MANYKMEKESRSFISDIPDSLPECKAGLLLGTSNKLRNGYPNPFFYNRISAAATLFKSGKIKYIIVSGDNRKVEYNEPQFMKDALIEAGVPDSVIYMDHAGFRTFDSVIRAKEIFGQNKYIIISQQFHNERAVYIARQYGIEAYGFNSKEVKGRVSYKTKIRECFARLKVFTDILIGREPKFLGEKVELGKDSHF